MPDNVSHPSHYNVGNIEVIAAIEDWGFGEGFNRGNAIKYIVRAGRKDHAAKIEDLKKAAWYINREIQRIAREEGDVHDSRLSRQDAQDNIPDRGRQQDAAELPQGRVFCPAGQNELHHC